MGAVKQMFAKLGSEGNATMKAAVYYKNGGPDVLKYEDVTDP